MQTIQEERFALPRALVEDSKFYRIDATVPFAPEPVEETVEDEALEEPVAEEEASVEEVEESTAGEAEEAAEEDTEEEGPPGSGG